ncbi:MAG: hypothetical protein QM607_03215, partial [Microbacterium sp.]
MNLALAAATIVAEGHEGNAQLATLPFFIIALVAFGALAVIALSFRNVANRHADPTESSSHDEAGHGH